MFRELFDSYNIRARLSVYVILITPIIVSIYVLYEPIRSIGASTILIIVLAAFSNYFLILLRHLVKHHYYSDTAALFLHPSDNHIESRTKERYYSALSAFDSSFSSLMMADTTEDDAKAICEDIILLLKNKTRNIHLVQEENILYGFINNLCNLKPLGLIVTAFSMVLQYITLTPDFTSIYALITDQQNMFLIITDLFFFIFWAAGVSLRICKSAAEKYAYALIGAIDNITHK